MQAFVNRLWYGKPTAGTRLLWLLLLPLSGLFAVITAVRRGLFTYKIKQTTRVDAPVIVVGNITVGGSGKSPTVVYLINLLRQHGLKPGVISRGYGVSFEGVRHVTPQSEAQQVGDEPLMIVSRTSVPMVIGASRVAAAQALVNEYDIDVVISDDGLQHYALARDIELVLIDGQRQLGNRCLIPAGPLREGAWRLQHVDFVINNGIATAVGETMSLVTEAIRPVNPMYQGATPALSEDWHAIAAIGNPQRFFDTLSQAGFNTRKQHGFDDHQMLTAADIEAVSDNGLVIMTEKDAVKCRDFAKDNWWYLPVSAKLSTEFETALMAKIHHQLAHKKGNPNGV
ncbi:tetraacyldisaccharide 4'-kinase [Shewanella waksmanii]|uniref:tetraacyldisaccharide 4'-kinase n=1 Tax=Shewanella waksmanii TaxID=213783 RepID=UPI0004902A34|nr:tetraacyldisaccharide 4'-kinase [Shewanella waksmanii]